MAGRNASGTTSTAQNQPARESDFALFNLLFTLAEIGCGLFCAFQQMTTTHDSIFGLLQGGTIVPSHATAQQILYVLQGNENKDNTIGWTIALVTQVVFLSCFTPGSPVHSPKLRGAIISIFFVLEVVSDMWYSVATGTTMLGAFTWIFNWGNGGWVVALCYITAMAAGSTLVTIDGFHRLQRLWQVLTAKK